LHDTFGLLARHIEGHESADFDLVIADSFYELVIAFELSSFHSQKMLIVVFDYAGNNWLDGFTEKAHGSQVALISLWIMPIDSLNEQKVVGVLLNIQT